MEIPEFSFVITLGDIIMIAGAAIGLIVTFVVWAVAAVTDERVRRKRLESIEQYQRELRKAKAEGKGRIVPRPKW